MASNVKHEKESAEDFAFDVMVSYARADQAVARELVERMKNRGVRVWFDMDQIGPGERIVRNLWKGLKTSRNLIALVSEDFPASEWTQDELEQIKYDSPAGRIRKIIPVMLDDKAILPDLLAGTRATQMHDGLTRQILDELIEAAKQ